MLILCMTELSFCCICHSTRTVKVRNFEQPDFSGNVSHSLGARNSPILIDLSAEKRGCTRLRFGYASYIFGDYSSISVEE